ncbi:hypothetical protein NKG05_10300 [Oerskovia sp. M15]
MTDVGQDFYAAQTFENAPDGRRTWMGWMGNWRYPYSAPTQAWQNAMSIPGCCRCGPWTVARPWSRHRSTS